MADLAALLILKYGIAIKVFSNVEGKAANTKYELKQGWLTQEQENLSKNESISDKIGVPTVAEYWNTLSCIYCPRGEHYYLIRPRKLGVNQSLSTSS